jgi:hypothetical protein
MKKLVAVRGLGAWSVEMFMCFALKRMDVFSTGDLGVQRGMAAYVGKDVKKLKAKGGGKWKYMSEKDMLETAEKFRPYRSLFMWYMWRIEEVRGRRCIPARFLRHLTDSNPSMCRLTQRRWRIMRRLKIFPRVLVPEIGSGQV